MKPSRQLGGILTLVAVVLLTGLWLRRVAGAHVIGRATTPEGGEMGVVQKFNWGFEPYTTSFAYRPPQSSAWHWYYFDHQDTYWSRCSRILVDTNLKVATFYRGATPALSFDWEKEIYWRGKTVWATGAQAVLSPDNWIPRLLGPDGL